MTKFLRALLGWSRPKHNPGLNPVKFTIRHGTKGREFYNRVERSGEIIFDGGESYKNRSDAVKVVVNTIKAIQDGDYEISEE